MSYFAILTCRNSDNCIEGAVESVFSQTVKPEYVIVVDDGSTDLTGAILQMLQQKHENLYVITNADNGHDTTRVVFNWNKALELAKTLPKCDYHLIATDDIIPESRYVEKLLAALEDPDVAIVSGTYLKIRIESPHGAGRMVRNAFFTRTRWRGRYPERAGYESAILYEAMRQSYKTQVVRTAYFDHIRPLGKNHRFRTFGIGMKVLDYHPLFVFGRFAVYFIRGTPIGRIGALQMYLAYLRAKPAASGFNSRFDSEFRAFVRSKQLRRIRKVLQR